MYCPLLDDAFVSSYACRNALCYGLIKRILLYFNLPIIWRWCWNHHFRIRSTIVIMWILLSQTEASATMWTILWRQLCPSLWQRKLFFLKYFWIFSLGMKRGNSQHCQYHSVDLEWDQSRRRQILYQLLPSSRLRHVTDPAVISAQYPWTSLSHVPGPFPLFSSSQKSWD